MVVMETELIITVKKKKKVCARNCVGRVTGRIKHPRCCESVRLLDIHRI